MRYQSSKNNLRRKDLGPGFRHSFSAPTPLLNHYYKSLKCFEILLHNENTRKNTVTIICYKITRWMGQSFCFRFAAPSQIIYFILLPLQLKQPITSLEKAEILSYSEYSLLHLFPFLRHMLVVRGSWLKLQV